jgi:hypothetical protein
MSSSETETRSRGRSALDRDGDLARGGVQPPSEEESRSRGRPALERGGTSPEGATGPRERRSFTSAASPLSSEAEFRPRVSRPPVWWAVGPWIYFTRVFRFVRVCFLRRQAGLPWLFRGPLWLSLTVAPEHLWVYPLGSRKC